MFNRQGWKRNRLLRSFIVCIIALLIVLSSPAIARSISLGQLPSLTTPSGTQPLPNGVERRGTLDSTEVRLDGKELFRIASPAVLNRSEPGSQIPVEVRAKQIERNLEQLATGNGLSDKEVLNPSTFQVVSETVNGQPVLSVTDATLVEAKVLLTVTDADAQYASVSKDQLATRWKEILERELQQALELRQPEALQQFSTVVKVLVATLLLTLMLGAAWAFFKQRKQRLEQHQAAEAALIHAQVHASELAPVEPSDAALGRQLFQGLRQHFSLQRRLQIVRFLQWLLFWAIALIWVVGVAYSLNAFPQTRQFARKVVTIPIVLLMTWFLTGLTNRLTDLVVDQFIQNREQEQSLTEANLQRISTIANAVKGLKMVVVYMVAILWVLQWLNLVPGSILTLGALLALAVSFAAQSLVKDLVNGFLILLEDQFRNCDLQRISGL